MFWCRGYYVDTVGRNTKKYMNNQRKEDWMTAQISLSDPFTGEKVKANKQKQLPKAAVGEVECFKAIRN